MVLMLVFVMVVVVGVGHGVGDGSVGCDFIGGVDGVDVGVRDGGGCGVVGGGGVVIVVEQRLDLNGTSAEVIFTEAVRGAFFFRRCGAVRCDFIEPHRNVRSSLQLNRIAPHRTAPHRSVKRVKNKIRTPPHRKISKNKVCTSAHRRLRWQSVEQGFLKVWVDLTVGKTAFISAVHRTRYQISRSA